jgi:GWxTD domain-containing protein
VSFGKSAIEVRNAMYQSMQWLRRAAMLSTLGLAACGGWQRVGSEPQARPEVVVPRLFDATNAFRGMGLLAAPDPIPFVAGVYTLAGGTPDSTLVALGLSLPNRALTFRRAGEEFEARYRVEVTFRRAGATLREASANEVVRVATLEETQRGDESVIFQQYLTLPPGQAAVRIVMRDRVGSNSSEVQDTVVVPRYDGERRLSDLVPIYAGQPRPVRTFFPDVVVNPRATVPYGTDTLKLYLEAYGVAEDVPFTLRALSVEEPVTELWVDTLELQPTGAIRTALITVAPERLPMGELRFEARVAAGDPVRAAMLVSFSEEWVVANFEETLSLLRYFGPDEILRQLGEAPAKQRAGLWEAFWKASDPDPATVEHEAMEAYFRRLQVANDLYREGSEPGWLTHRGEVYVSLGPPDETFDSSTDVQGEGLRFIRWTYIGERLTVIFQDRSGFGHYELIPESRAAFQEVLQRIKRGG